MEENIIILKQEPIIAYSKIEEVGKEVQKRIAELNLENILVTEEGVKPIKDTRANLNKEFATFEERRKMIKKAVEMPYKEFEAKYNEFIAQHYKQADETLKVKINAFENQLKAEKENEVKEYFTELCQAKNIDFVEFSRLGIKVGLSDSLKKLKSQVDIFIGDIEKDLDYLNNATESEVFKADVFFEYRKNLDMLRALQITQERHNARREAERKNQEAESNKQAEVVSQEVKSDNQPPATENKPLTAPIVEEPQKVFKISFSVRGTMEQIKALKEFIISNNIEIIK